MAQLVIEKPPTQSINCRIPQGMVDLIDKDLITAQVHSNRTDWVMTAIHFYLQYRVQFNSKLKEDGSGGGV